MLRESGFDVLLHYWSGIVLGLGVHFAAVFCAELDKDALLNHIFFSLVHEKKKKKVSCLPICSITCFKFANSLVALTVSL